MVERLGILTNSVKPKQGVVVVSPFFEVFVNKEPVSSGCLVLFARSLVV
jgi:hypothetical protein